RDGGPEEWFQVQMEAAYARLADAGEPPPPAPAAPTGFASILRPGHREEVLARPAASVWLDRLGEDKRREGASVRAAAAVLAAAPAAPFVPGARNWLPLGPTVVLHGQTIGNEPVGGRVAGLAVAPGGRIVYAASSCGGVFRSDDGATTWRSLMDGF